MDPAEILKALVAALQGDEDGDLLNDFICEYGSLQTSDEVESETDQADVRISWGGRDLFDLSIKRV